MSSFLFDNINFMLSFSDSKKKKHYSSHFGCPISKYYLIRFLFHGSTFIHLTQIMPKNHIVITIIVITIRWALYDI